MRLSRLKQLLKKYQDGKATDVERLVVDAWYDAYADTGEVPPGLASEGDRRAMRERLWAGIPKRETRLPWYRHNLIRWAASIILATGLAASIYAIRNDSTRKNSQQSAAIGLAEVIATGSRQVKRIQLPDSTTVWLNANSRLEVLPGYGGRQRRIRLHGEAFFDVRRDTARPFVVDTRGIAVEVLGTSFNIQAYERLPEVAVVVNSGKVSVSDASSRHLADLSVGEGLTYGAANGSLRVENLLANDSHAWRNGVIILDRAPFEQLVQGFQNLYGVELTTNDDAVASYRYNITFKSTMRQEEALELIGNMLGKNYRKEEDGTIQLY